MAARGSPSGRSSCSRSCSASSASATDCHCRSSTRTSRTSFPVPGAWGTATSIPDWYDYPSLLMGVLAPVQAFFGAPALGAARLAAVAIGVGGVAATWWLGRRAYGTGAAIVGAASVAVATTHVAYSRMAVTDVLLTLAVDVRPRACGRGPDRVGGVRGRSRRVGEVPGGAHRRCRSWSPGGGGGARSVARQGSPSPASP